MHIYIFQNDKRHNIEATTLNTTQNKPSKSRPKHGGVELGHDSYSVTREFQSASARVSTYFMC